MAFVVELLQKQAYSDLVKLTVIDHQYFHISYRIILVFLELS